MKTDAVDQLLTFEEVQLEENTEIPFFHYLAASAMISDIPRAPKGAYYNFKKGFDSTFSETVRRFQQELSEGQSGPATDFLQKIAAHYPQQYDQIFAGLITKYAPALQESLISLLRAMPQELSMRLIPHILEMPTRQAMTNEELRTILAKCNISKQGLFNPTQFPQDVLVLLEDRDFVTVQESLRSGGDRVSAEIDIDKISGDVYVAVTNTYKNEIKTVPFKMNLLGDTDSLTLEVVDDTVSPEIAEQYRNVVAIAIQKAAKVARELNQAEVRKQQAEPLSKTQLDRDARIALYREKKEQQPVNIGDNEELPAVRMSQTLESTPELDKEVPALRVIGLDEETVEAFLKERNIQVIDVEGFMKKMKYYIHVANQTNTFFGKQIITSQYGGQFANIDLREINWLVGGNNALRIIVHHVGNRQFELKGILHKKGTSQQTQFIEKIVRQIHQSDEK